MVLKLDISKAYDKVNWNFLFKVLKTMGFGDKLIKLIGECISTVTYFVLLNGSPLENFRASRGLRQGDPLSPYLFIILAEVLDSNFNSMVNKGALLGIKPASMVPPNVLQQFVDDTILFGISSVLEATGGLVAGGGVIRTQLGALVATYVGNLNEHSSNQVEEMALAWGIYLAVTMGIRIMDIGGDSKLIIDVVKGRNRLNWTIEGTIRDTLRLIFGLDLFKIVHVYREGNRVANALVGLPDHVNFLLQEEKYKIPIND
ncbi:uncharacterized protein LOC131027422 [Cryptomeria japonica]|uniref:uncharacterized protein LOC131027422 n=1 Tax=Cryptomeria japonica TaxID=3369 RepID=UPI0027D9FCE9|nr:uncharacterized protein LOC131027422 [Cryptomeria japonica]